MYVYIYIYIYIHIYTCIYLSIYLLSHMYARVRVRPLLYSRNVSTVITVVFLSRASAPLSSR